MVQPRYASLKEDWAPNVHTPGPAEKAGKSSKLMEKLAGVSPHEEAVAVAAVLKTAAVFERRSDEEVSLVVS